MHVKLTVTMGFDRGFFCGPPINRTHCQSECKLQIQLLIGNQTDLPAKWRAKAPKADLSSAIVDQYEVSSSKVDEYPLNLGNIHMALS